MAKATRNARRGATVDFVEVLPQPKQWIGFQILGALVRTRAEITVLVALIVAYFWLDSFGNVVLTVTVMVGVPAIALAVPHSRRFIVGRAWCVFDRHRLRTCLKQTKIRTMNRDGQFPYLLWSRPTKTGERIWMWLPAGSAARDIEDALDYMAPACLARAARIHTVRKLTTVCAVDIVRRDPLATKNPLDSPLSGGLDGEEAAGNVTPIKPADLRRSSASSDAKPRSTTTKTTETKPLAASSSVVVNGEDLSDYVD